MTEIDNEAMIARCDQLTEDGRTLTIEWDGGGDSGEFTMKLDDEEISDQTPIDEQIMERVAEDVGYGSFAGDFSAQGSAVYDREEKAFLGSDYYSSSEEGIRTCAIAVAIPSWLWFDRLRLRVLVDEADNEVPEVHLIVQNGPRIEAHEAIELTIANQLFKALELEMEKIEDCHYVVIDTSINAGGFASDEENVVFTILDFGFGYDDEIENNISVYFTDKNEKHEIV